MIELYHSPFSTCSQKVRLALAEKGLSYESRLIDFRRQDHLKPAYLELNPNGVVPTLVHDGNVITDSSVICEYLDEVFPDPPLGPRDPVGRARLRAWLRYFEEVATPAVRVPSFNKLFAKGLNAMSPEAFEELTARLPLRKHFYRKLGPGGFDQRLTDESLEQLRQTFERMDAATRERPFLMGDDYTIADICVIPSIVRLDDLDMAELWSDLPAVGRWYERIQARPSFAVAYMPGSRFGANA